MDRWIDRSIHQSIDRWIDYSVTVIGLHFDILPQFPFYTE